MAFPTTGILSTFTGADEDPLSEGGNWDGSIRAARGRHVRASNEMRPGSTGNNTKQSYWTPNTFTETEVYATITSKAVNDGDLLVLDARISPADVKTDNVDEYQLHIGVAAGADTWSIHRSINATGTLLATLTATEVAVGDSVGFEVLGTGATVTLNAHHKPSGGSWALVGTVDDTHADRITTAGYIGTQQGATLWYLDDFGGGEVVAAAAETTILRPAMVV